MSAQNIFEKELSKESIFKDRNVMSPHYVPDQLLYRDREIESVMKMVLPALKGKRPNNVFIYGKTGTGKTATVRNVLKSFDQAKEKHRVSADYLYLNCRIHNSRYQVLLKCAERMTMQQKYLGYSVSFLYDTLLKQIPDKGGLIVVLDEVDKIKDVDELVYTLTRINDDLESGFVSIIGISNNVFFKQKLDPRSKSTLCEQELVFHPYNADELKHILKQRVRAAFRRSVVPASAINLASAYAAQESGDARYALNLLLRAGEIAEKNSAEKVSEEDVKKARKSVEEDIVYELISTLPDHQRMVLYAIASLDLEGSKNTRLVEVDDRVYFSGEVYETYEKVSSAFSIKPRSARWYRQYLNDLEMLGLITTTSSGKGIRGNTTLIRLAFPADKIKEVIEKKFR